MIILRMLPVDTPPSLAMSLQEITNVIELKEKIEKQVDLLEEHKRGHGLRVQMVESEPNQQACFNCGGLGCLSRNCPRRRMHREDALLLDLPGDAPRIWSKMRGMMSSML